MSNGRIAVRESDDPTAVLDQEEVVIEAETRLRPRVRLAGADPDALVEPTDTAPGASDYGLPVRVGDGHNVALGATSDAMAAPGAAASATGSLRRLTQDLADALAALLLIVASLASILARLPAAFTAGGGVKVGLVDAVPAGANLLGKIGIDQTTPGTTDRVTVAGGISIKVPLTVSTSPAYTAGDAIGGKITLANAVRLAGGKSLLESLMVLDRSNQKPTFDVLFFDADPAAATITDNSGFVFSTDDLKCVGRVNVTTGDFVTLNGKATASFGALNRIMQAASGTSLYAAAVATTTPTFVATTDVQLIFGFAYLD